MLRKWICAGLAAAMLSSTAFASDRLPESWIVEGNTRIVKANDAVNINPYNIAAITGVGEGNVFRLVDTYDSFDIPLTAPLYRLSENYRDQIVYEDGKWGVKRMVAVKIFDGSEDWSLLSRPGYQNNNTTIFSCTNTTQTAVWDGLSTHFDVFSKEEQKNNRYDGISFGRNTDEIYMRIMNVRKVTTVEELKNYLKAQYDAGTPVKFFFALKEAVFEPFDDMIQIKMNNADLSKLGFMDSHLDKISAPSAYQVNASIFQNQQTANVEMNRFLSSIVDLKIYGGNKDLIYYIEGIYPNDDGFMIVMKDSQLNSYSGTLAASKASFTKDKPAELILKQSQGNGSVRMLLNLSKAEYLTKELAGFTAEQTAVQPECIVSSEMVMPQYLPVVIGQDTSLFLENALLYGQTDTGTVTDTSLSEGLVLVDNVLNIVALKQNASASLKLDGGRQSFETAFVSIPNEAGAGQTRTVLFLGDSLINQDLYTQSLSGLFEEDDMNLTLIGTRGTENNRHEGRGGWAAYDYCNVSSKYGYTNPFLNNGSFDFGYYMEQNKFEQLDSVVINLGINDLNLVGHNSHQEIIKYFNQIITSIHNYNPDIKILLNAPTMLYAAEATDTAKNQRLEFIKTLNKHFGGKEKENIYLMPAYLSLNPQMGFKQIEPVIDEFNQSHALIVTDTTHPNDIGYNALAQMTYQYLKFIETLR